MFYHQYPSSSLHIPPIWLVGSPACHSLESKPPIKNVIQPHIHVPDWCLWSRPFPPDKTPKRDHLDCFSVTHLQTTAVFDSHKNRWPSTKPTKHCLLLQFNFRFADIFQRQGEVEPVDWGWTYHQTAGFWVSKNQQLSVIFCPQFQHNPPTWQLWISPIRCCLASLLAAHPVRCTCQVFVPIGPWGSLAPQWPRQVKSCEVSKQTQGFCK